MAGRSINVSLTPEMRASIDARVQSGQYGDVSDVIRAGLRALAREEMVAGYREFQKIMSKLPQEPITSEIEQEVAEAVRQLRSTEQRTRRK
ncbi:MAG: type II toxin-antitoxin system ParD family antitoxin [Verrucomicrobia bacterium]|nr:type II toxin-antitoxin system ParD family antitoxin [Verrucomicrobiota bacterium]